MGRELEGGLHENEMCVACEMSGAMGRDGIWHFSGSGINMYVLCYHIVFLTFPNFFSVSEEEEGG